MMPALKASHVQNLTTFNNVITLFIAIAIEHRYIHSRVSHFTQV